MFLVLRGNRQREVLMKAPISGCVPVFSKEIFRDFYFTGKVLYGQLQHVVPHQCIAASRNERFRDADTWSMTISCEGAIENSRASVLRSDRLMVATPR